MTIRAMTLDDLRMVLGWAADEGWNPGLDDAAAFWATDRAGFLIKELDGAPVAAVCVVNHTPDFAFLGLYICKPGFRGQGHGFAVWQAGIAHAGDRCIGLDGVPDQQDNYACAGFVRYGQTTRFAGQIVPATGIDPEADSRIRAATPDQIPELMKRDQAACGVARTAFASAWLHGRTTRQSMVLTEDGQISGFATFRRCGDGTKIGPLHAACATDAQALLAANPFAAPGAPVFVDVPDTSTALRHLLETQGFTPTFETTRMYRGSPPPAHPAPFYAIATMELG